MREDQGELTAAVPDGERRLQLYAYLQAREHQRTYLEIMRLFASTLLADLSAGEVAGALAGAERAGRVEPGESRIESVIPRLRQLVEWGNLVHGRRETVAASIAEFQHGSARYQVSKLAVRVQRDVDELLRVPEGAREVSRELLPAIERGLRELTRTFQVATGDDPRAARHATELLSEQVTTLFLQHAELAATVRDFYAYLGHVLARHHLAPDEISGFRDLLVDYIQKVVEDVLRHTPAIADTLAGLTGRRGELLTLLGPAERLGEDVERSRGRTEDDWRELTDWFVDRPGRPSQVTALREATARAIGSLLASVKRATTGAGLLPGRRAELLKLARWFDEAGPDGAHALYAAAFGLHSARHLMPAPDHDADDEHTPWRDGPVLDVSVSVRSRGDRGARGRTSRIVDDPMTEQALLAEAREVDAQRTAAVRELASAAPRLGEARLSSAALSVLCDLLTLAMAQRERADDTGSAADPVRGLRLRLRPEEGRTTRISTAGGVLTLHDTAIELGAEGKTE
ncbi:TIGR02677 family protein [Longimycelium tulufanense]|uniref:TIGR02677 family protein n=1 Tax=Longimycelium tulufanense TaxID=907463 RepID=A0A8J3CAD9_9PSEU|nr:TIGR02677 family protein [Longimycelium tulufanense]GGM64375.1 TIGR02677 family protein [Longimycelium tulufanense]